MTRYRRDVAGRCFVTSLILWLVSGSGLECTTTSNSGGYSGISSVQPTGSISISANRLVAAYDMGSLTGDGRLKDFSGNGTHGTIYSTAAVPGRFGQARRFGSAEDRIALPGNSGLAIDGPLSVAMWVRVRRLGLHQHAVACDDKFVVWITPDDHLRFTDTRGHGFQTKGGLAVETWYSIVATFSGNAGDALTRENIAVYINGEPVEGQVEGTWSPGVLHAKDACHIGFESHQGLESHKSLHFDGDIDEILIFSRALTASEIKAHATIEEHAALRVAGGLGSAAGLAFNPAGAPFVAIGGGRVVRILGRDSSLAFIQTGGSAAGLAFDGSGDLYIADRQRGAVLRATPSGQMSVVADGFASPERLAISGAGEIYVADSGASRLYRISTRGKAVVASGLAGVRGIAVSIDGRRLFVSDGSQKIWQCLPDGTSRTLFAAFTDPGQPAGMALDEKGNLYVARDGGSKVSVLNPQGVLIDSFPLPGPRVTAVAFGGLDLKTLFVAEAETGALYKLAVPYRSQRLAWEADSRVRIVEPVDGAILNRHDGEKTDAGLRIRVKGWSGLPGSVRVNGVSVPVKDGQFQTTLLLRQQENRIVVEAQAGLRDAIAVLWDRDSFPRYRFSTDDNIRFLKNIALHAGTYNSIFDNPYLNFWREMHQKYGTKVQHNIYYEAEGFNLSQMPDKFRSEWQQNAG